MGLISALGTKIPHAIQHGQKNLKKRKKESFTYNKFNWVLVSFQERGKQRRADVCLRRVFFIKAKVVIKCVLCSRQGSKCFAEILSFNNTSQQTHEAATHVALSPVLQMRKLRPRVAKEFTPGHTAIQE